MNSIPENPFTNRSMIKITDRFIGREAEITNILSRVRNGDSVSIVGDRRIGKSSLLYHLFLTANERLNDPTKTNYNLFYIDLQDPHYATMEGFCRNVIKKLDEQLGISNASLDCKTDLDYQIALTEKLDLYAKEKALPVLMFDEFEQLTNKSDRFNDDFFNTLRHVATRYDVSLITSTNKTLRELTETEGLTSPLWNIFMVQPMGEFIEDEVELFLKHFWMDVLSPTPEEMTFLISYCSRHPLIMQVVSFWVLKNRELGYDELFLKKEVENELSSYFRNRNEIIAKWLKRKAVDTRTAVEWTTGQLKGLPNPFSLSLSIK